MPRQGGAHCGAIFPGASKFSEGAWLSVLLPAPLAIVPIRRRDAVSMKALRMGLCRTRDVVAVQVLTGARECDDLTSRWKDLVEAVALGAKPPRLTILRTQYRQLYGPLLDFASERASEHSDRQIAVIVPQLVEARWYHTLFHNHASSFLKALLLLKGGPQSVLINTPWYLRDWVPERRRIPGAQRARRASWFAREGHRAAEASKATPG